jgi:hypothetical protein
MRSSLGFSEAVGLIPVGMNECVAAGDLVIGFDHLPNKFRKRNAWRPTELYFDDTNGSPSIDNIGPNTTRNKPKR